MNSLIVFLIMLTGIIGWQSANERLEAKFNPPEIKQNSNFLEPNFIIKTFPLLDKSVKYNFRTKSGLAIDLNNDLIIWEKEKDEVRPIASITKMMTALVLTKNRDLDEVITIPGSTVKVEGSSGGFYAGEKVTIKDLIIALLIPSANDGAEALRLDLKKKGFDLIGEMNKEAQKLGLEKTHFEDSIGLSEKNVSTAWELYLLSKELLKNNFLKEIVAQSEAEICAKSGSCHFLINTNRLLNDAGFSGIKTGYTDKAGNCFIGLKYINKEFPTIFVILGAPDGHTRFDDPDVASQYLEWYGLY